MASWVLSAQKPENELLRLLDIGCSRGEFNELIDSPSLVYTGIEPFKDDYLFASGMGLNVKHLTAEEAVKCLKEEFNILVFGDVLEHLVDPNSVLKKSKDLLSEGGWILISVPNVAHLTNRLSLLFGFWDYKDRGIRDRTHLRFFTVKTIKEMCWEAGFQITELDFTPIPIEAITSGRQLPFFKILDYLNYALTRSAPKLFAYQIVLKLQIMP
jgi:2-polyprenyl-3-methyl-5-hydroxy-6-metoxy-1,4-benzoquinol methylase